MLFQQLESLPRVMLPVQQQLVLDKLGARGVDDFRAKSFVLKKLQQVEALRA